MSARTRREVIAAVEDAGLLSPQALWELEVRSFTMADLDRLVETLRKEFGTR